MLLLTVLKTGCQNDFFCEERDFLYSINNTCFPCPSSCSNCWYDTSNLLYPCQTCTEGFYIEFPDHRAAVDRLDRYNASCTKCDSEGVYATVGSRLLYLEQSGIYEVDGYYEGRLWIHSQDVWGLICDDGWGMEETTVACHELGLGRALNYFRSYHVNQPDNATIVMDDMSCSGAEQSLYQCRYTRRSDHNCGIHEVVGIRCSGPDLNVRCLEVCRVGDYDNIDSHICESCDSSCLSCALNPGFCTMCDYPLFLSQDNRCVPKCGSGYYGNIMSRRCEPCGANCFNCADGSSNDTCTACDGGNLLYDNRCWTNCPENTKVLRTSSPNCVDICPTGYFAAGESCQSCGSSCRSCSNSSNNCTSCPANYVLQTHYNNDILTSSRCQLNCDDAYYPSLHNICILCNDSSCQKCYKGGVYCKLCKEGYLLEMHRCTPQCSQGLYRFGEVCTSSCPPGYFSDPSLPGCSTCPSNCQGCVNGSICTTCSIGYYLKGPSCVLDCGLQYVAFSNPTSDDIRLVGGRYSTEGRMEIFLEGE